MGWCSFLSTWCGFVVVVPGVRSEVASLHGFFHLCTLLGKEFLGGVISWCLAFCGTPSGILFLHLVRMVVDVLLPANLAVLHLLNKMLFGIILLFCHCVFGLRFYIL